MARPLLLFLRAPAVLPSSSSLFIQAGARNQFRANPTSHARGNLKALLASTIVSAVPLLLRAPVLPSSSSLSLGQALEMIGIADSELLLLLASCQSACPAQLKFSFTRTGARNDRNCRFRAFYASCFLVRAARPTTPQTLTTPIFTARTLLDQKPGLFSYLYRHRSLGTAVSRLPQSSSTWLHGTLDRHVACPSAARPESAARRLLLLNRFGPLPPRGTGDGRFLDPLSASNHLL